MNHMRYNSVLYLEKMPCDESWIYCYDPETKRQTSQWKYIGSARPKKTSQSKSTHKLVMIPFFNSPGMIYMHCVPSGQTVNKEYYVEVLREFRKRFRWKRPALFKSGQWYFHQDNAPVHKSILVTDYLTKIGIKTVPHPPYSADLGPCDFWLFPKIRSCRYETIDEMKEAVTKVIDTLTQVDFHVKWCWWLERSLSNSCYTKVLGRALLLSLDCSTLPLIRNLLYRLLSKEVSSTIFESGLIRPNIEPWETGPLANTLSIRPIYTFCLPHFRCITTLQCG